LFVAKYGIMGRELFLILLRALENALQPIAATTESNLYGPTSRDARIRTGG
jgi:hypothetical protein